METTFQPHIRIAKAIVVEEIEIVTSERDAFGTFLKRLDALGASVRDQDVRHARPATTSLSVERPEPASGTRSKIEEMYAETVMATPHYTDEYNDSITDSMAIEFGTSAVEYINAPEVLTTVSLAVISELARNSVVTRTRFLGILKTERESLSSSECRLNCIERRFHEVYENNQFSRNTELFMQEMDSLRDRCEEVARCRQRLVHNRSASAMSGVGVDSLLGYLYEDMDVRCPVLADVSTCLRSIRNACR